MMLLGAVELEAILRAEVQAAGGAKKWLRKKKVKGFEHILHMVADGRAATLDDMLTVLGYERIVVYKPLRS